VHVLSKWDSGSSGGGSTSPEDIFRAFGMVVQTLSTSVSEGKRDRGKSSINLGLDSLIDAVHSLNTDDEDYHIIYITGKNGYSHPLQDYSFPFIFINQ
jgi:hypothetical protein